MPPPDPPQDDAPASPVHPLDPVIRWLERLSMLLIFTGILGSMVVGYLGQLADPREAFLLGRKYLPWTLGAAASGIGCFVLAFAIRFVQWLTEKAEHGK